MFSREQIAKSVVESTSRKIISCLIRRKRRAFVAKCNSLTQTLQANWKCWVCVTAPSAPDLFIFKLVTVSHWNLDFVPGGCFSANVIINFMLMKTHAEKKSGKEKRWLQSEGREHYAHCKEGWSQSVSPFLQLLASYAPRALCCWPKLFSSAFPLLQDLQTCPSETWLRGGLLSQAPIAGSPSGRKYLEVLATPSELQVSLSGKP